MAMPSLMYVVAMVGHSSTKPTLVHSVIVVVIVTTATIATIAICRLAVTFDHASSVECQSSLARVQHLHIFDAGIVPRQRGSPKL